MPKHAARSLATGLLLAAGTLAVAGGGSSAQVLELSIVDATTGSPVSNVEATLSDPTGSRFGTWLSDAAGLVALNAPPGDTLTVSLAAPGYRAWTYTIVATSDMAPLPVMLTPGPVELPGVEVSVRARARQLGMLAFQERRRRGIGKFVGPEEIERTVATQTADYLRRVPGIRLYGGQEPIFTRGGIGVNGECLPQVYVDGFLARDASRGAGLVGRLGFDLLVPPHDVAAIEAYSGPGTPPEYRGSGAGCGVILIWTKIR